MKATLKFYARPDKAPTTEVVPIVAVNSEHKGGVTLRLHAVGDNAPTGEFQIRMDPFEALSLAAEIVLKVARNKAF